MTKPKIKSYHLIAFFRRLEYFCNDYTPTEVIAGIVKSQVKMLNSEYEIPTTEQLIALEKADQEKLIDQVCKECKCYADGRVYRCYDHSKQDNERAVQV